MSYLCHKHHFHKW